MALSRNEKGNLARLRKCVSPAENRINKIKAKMTTSVTAWNNEIAVLEEEIKGYKEMIQSLEARDINDVEPVVELNTIEEEPTTEELVPFFPENFNEDNEVDPLLGE